MQRIQRGIGGGREPALGGERVVDVGQHAVHAGRHRAGHVAQWLQQSRWGAEAPLMRVQAVTEPA
jgi:hypothetical protein